MNIPEQGIKLHAGNFAAIGQHLQPYLNDGKCYRLQLKPWREKRSLSQNALSHMWYTEISEYLIKSGRTDATPEWVKRNLKRHTSAARKSPTPISSPVPKKPPGNLATRLNSIPERCTSSCAKSKRGALSLVWR